MPSPADQVPPGRRRPRWAGKDRDASADPAATGDDAPVSGPEEAGVPADGGPEANSTAEPAGSEENGGPDEGDAQADDAADDTPAGKDEAAADDKPDAEPVAGDAAAAEDKDTADDKGTAATDDKATAATGKRPGRATRIIAGAVSVFGELLITAGIVLGLFVAYSLWWTNVVANQEAQRDGNAVRELWEEEPAEPGEPPVYDAEEGIGFLHVPEMTGSEILVKEGIDLSILNGGVAGYYDTPVESAMPWDDEGNFSLAAHRDGHGAKFHNIHRLDEGDAIVFETRDTWYIYKVYATLPETSRFNTAVLDPIPEESGKTEPGQYITLTTCTPFYTSTYRYIVWGELERTEEVDEQRTPPPELRDS